MTKTLAAVLVMFASMTTACSVELDPAYLKAHEDLARDLCKCAKEYKKPTVTVDGVTAVELDKLSAARGITTDCMKPFEDAFEKVKTPTGEEHRGPYESSLSDDDQAKLDRLRSITETCRFSSFR